MADKENTEKLQATELNPTKDVSAKTGKDKKKPNFFKRAWSRIQKWFKELKSEAKKVTWPSFKQVVNNTLVVFAVVIVVGVIIMLADVAFRSGLDLILDLFK